MVRAGEGGMGLREGGEGGAAERGGAALKEVLGGWEVSSW